jgi:probable F420-dependent oxidoreductase
MPTDRRFRFGLVAALARSGEEWAALARRAEDLGYETLLIPDTANTLAPFPAAAAAAAATSSLRVGTYVLAAPLRPPAVVAWETGTLGVLTSGRFELGLGAGRPDAEADAARLGVPYGSPGERVAQVEAVIRAVRERAGAQQQPPVRVLVAAAGPRLLGVAARLADTVAFGLGPQAGEDSLNAVVATVREAAGDRWDELELSCNLLAVGEEVPPWLRRFMDVDVAALAAAGSIAVLTGTAQEMADRVARRREVAGVSYVTVNSGFAEQLAPVVERLAGT